MNGFKVTQNEDGDMVLTKEHYEDLTKAAAWLDCLNEAGVDNWEGISYAYELHKENE